MKNPNFIKSENSPHSHSIAYHHYKGKMPEKTGVLFCTGFKSDMQGSKALAIEDYCIKQGRQFTRFDYSAHGQSKGDFLSSGLSDWIQDTILILEKICQGPQLIVGSSMGGWVMLNIAISHPHLIKGLLGIAAAPDFTERLVWPNLTPEQHTDLEIKGYIEVASDYPEACIISKHLIEDGRQNLVLDQLHQISCPIRLIQGEKDQDVPWAISTEILQKIGSADCELTLIKNGDHRLSSPEQITKIITEMQELLDSLDYNS